MKNIFGCGIDVSQSIGVLRVVVWFLQLEVSTNFVSKLSGKTTSEAATLLILGETLLVNKEGRDCVVLVIEGTEQF